MSEKQSNMGRILKDKGSRKLLLFAGVAIVAVVGYTVFGSHGGAKETSRMRATPALDSTQGGTQVSSVYADSLKAADQERAEAAKKAADAGKLNAGQGAMPTVTAQVTNDRLPSSLEGQDEKPPQESKPPERPTPKPPERPVPRPPTPAAATEKAPKAAQAQEKEKPKPQGPQVDPALVAAMRAQMQHIIGDAYDIKAATTNWYYTAPREQIAGASSEAAVQAGYGQAPVVPTGNGGAAPQAAAPQAAAPQAAAQSRFRTPVAGTILYARLIGKVNSDVPGPVIAEILQGPFSGARLLGTFAASEQGVIIQFSTMTVAWEENGEDRSEVVPINAVAVDTKHLGSALATDIDRHMFEKIAFGFATSFIQGLGQAIGMSGSTTTTRADGSQTTSNPLLSTKDKLMVAGGQAAATTGQILQQEYGNRKTTITVEADTPFGLLFLGTGN